MVGRDGELGVLRNAATAHRRGESPVVVVRGEPGIGKSRLLRELTAELGQVRPVLWGSCLNISDPPALGPIIPVIRNALQALGDTEREDLPAWTRAAVDRLLSEDDAASTPLGDARALLFEAFLAIIDRLAVDRAPVLVIEDVHWIDRSSWDLLTYLVHQLDQRPLLTVMTHRPLPRGNGLRDSLLELTRLPQVTALELEPLTRSLVAEQLAGLTGADPEPDRLESVMARSGGNPFFVEMLADDSVAADSRIRAHLLAPLDHLDAETRRVVHVVAAAAPYAGHALLATVADLPEPELSNAVRRAVDAGLLSAEGSGYRFRHVLLRDAIYEESLIPGERAALHLAIAAAIDADPGLAPPVRHFAPSEAGRHWELGGDTTKAIDAYWTSAAQARALHFHPERVVMLDRVLRLWDEVPDAKRLLGTSRADVMMNIVEASDLSGDVVLGMDRAEQAIAAALGEDRPETAARVLERRARMRRRLGVTGATEDLVDALRLATDTPLHGRMLAFLAQRQWLSGHRRDEVEETASRALKLAEPDVDPFAAVHARLTLAWLPALDGDLEGSRRRHSEARQDAAMGENGAVLVVRSYLDESALLRACGAPEHAADAARRGMRYAGDLGCSATSVPHAAAHLAEPLIALGSWGEAGEVIEAGLAAAPPRGYLALLLRLRARISTWQGDLDAATRDLQEIHEVVGSRFEAPDEQFAVAQLEAEVRLMRGDGAGAWLAVQRALDCYPAKCHSTNGWALLAVGAQASRRLLDEDPERRRQPARDNLTSLGEIARRQPRHFAMDEAWHATYVATTTDGPARPVARREQVAAWRRVHEPAMLASALVQAADDTPDPLAAREHLREAAEIATRLGATALSTAVGTSAARRGVAIDAPAPSTPDTVGDPTARSWGLTAREHEVLQELATGKTNREIAGALFITPKTASVHVSRILMKTQSATRSEATAKAFRHGAVVVH